MQADGGINFAKLFLLVKLIFGYTVTAILTIKLNFCCYVQLLWLHHISVPFTESDYYLFKEVSQIIHKILQ